MGWLPPELPLKNTSVVVDRFGRDYFLYESVRESGYEPDLLVPVRDTADIELLPHEAPGGCCPTGGSVWEHSLRTLDRIAAEQRGDIRRCRILDADNVVGYAGTTGP